ncbi:DUF975 family protein [Fusibacter ferrireducens]|uniref:DUF975 family protein n=1 Tax=Fusibacter ferrireducens TaxID=2785058 RepID=A0ABR9ZT68_9FIRM|nr:DUF975 family protein [Fusibacter ferrireducens]MBF4693638.1 DUF975 family protein [Fusibacter ferrireducens]
MWSRIELKTKAKKFLKQNYMTAFFVSMIIMVVTGASTRSNSRMDNFNPMPRVDVYQNGHITFDGLTSWLPVFSFAIIVMIVVFIALRVFVGYILEVGGRNYFLRGTEREVSFREVGFGFNSEYYFNIVITMLIRSVYNLLWVLLLIIPGIVKYYAYSMVPYILADNPNIESGRAIELSMDMTRGQKWDIFVLDLSFIGWYILGGLLFGIGVWFVNPYADATKAQLYASLRVNAIRHNLCTPDELCYTPVDSEESESDDWYDEY